jgi:hypothetical protein
MEIMMRKHCRARLQKSGKGVSDVVANILILGITVTLFSSVFFFVGQLPSPTGQTYVDLHPNFTYNGQNTTDLKYNYTLTIEHDGGQAIESWKSRIMIFGTGQDSGGSSMQFSLQLNILGSTPSIGDKLFTGKTLKYFIYVRTTPQSTMISINFVDTDKGNMFWERTMPVSLIGGPYIVDKGLVVEDPVTGNWDSVSLVQSDQEFRIYIRVFDPLNKLANVSVNMSRFSAYMLPGPYWMQYSIFGERYETISKFRIGGVVSKLSDNAYVTVTDKLGKPTNETVGITVVPATYRGIDYVDVGQLCDHSTNLSSGREIEFSNDQPMTGEKILITASIRNIGTLAASSANVTFKDGTGIIGTTSVSVSALGKVSATVPWSFKTPGTHRIWVNVTSVNPADRNPDVTIGRTDYRNLFVCRDIRVYVYYDDFEGPMDKWRREATLLRINGEGPLEYDNYSTNVDISSDWDPSMSNIGPGNWTKSNEDYRTYPYCYKMTEYGMPPRRALDVTMVLDNSGSMAGIKWTNLVAAAKTFVGSMDGGDRCAIYAFQGGSGAPTPFLAAPFTVTDSTGRTSLNATIDSLSPMQATPLWDTIGAAMSYTILNCSMTRLPVVIAMTDGNDDRTTSSFDDETASSTYCPGSPVGGMGRTWATSPPSDGCVWGGASRHFVGIQRYRSTMTLDTLAWIDSWRKGLISSPVLTYTVGLMPAPQASNSSYPNYVAPTDPNYKYTTEFDLRQIAETTKADTLTGRYFYGGNPADLLNIYKTIAGLLNNWSNSQKSITDPSHPDSDGISDGSAVGQAIIQGGSAPASAVPAPEPAAIIYTRDFNADNGGWSNVITTGVSPNTAGNAAPTDAWQWGTPSGGPTSDHSGTGKCWDVNLGANYNTVGLGSYAIAVRSPTISLAGYSGVSLTFWFWSDVEGANWDGMNVKAWNGVNWAVVTGPVPNYDTTVYVGSGNPLAGQWAYTYDHNTAWVQVTVSLATYSGNANFQLEFDFGADQNTGGPGVAIDDVTITGSVGVNNPPSAATTPSGPSSGSTGTSYSYSTSATDPDGDQIKYTFDWGDGTPQTTTGFVANGTPSSASHTWTIAGTYNVKAFATDFNSASGSWSSSLPVTISSTGGGGSGVKYYGNKSLVTTDFDLGINSANRIYYSSAKLSFDHKFNLFPGSNGGAIFVGLKIGGSWKWRYVSPQPTYTGNLNVTSNYTDNNMDFPGPLPKQNQRVFYVYNGISGGGSFTWEHAVVDLTPYIPGNSLNSPGIPSLGSKVRVKFAYLYCGGGNNGGWWLDNIEVKVTRNESWGPVRETKDIWTLVNGTSGIVSHNGTHSWFNRFEDDNGAKMSLDNSLITTINLVSVQNATLQFYTKFNVNKKDGLPPQGFRVEVSDDNGDHWRQINKGVRTGYGVSGNGTFADDSGDGVKDGKAWGGIHAAGDPSNKSWVPSTSLTRLNCDLSKWSGRVILLRFRVVINNNLNFPAYEENRPPHGLYIDDVVVIGSVAQKSVPVNGISSQMPINPEAASNSHDGAGEIKETPVSSIAPSDSGNVENRGAGGLGVSLAEAGQLRQAAVRRPGQSSAAREVEACCFQCL